MIIPLCLELPSHPGGSPPGVNLPASETDRRVERILEIELSPEERDAFDRSVAAVKSLVETMNKLVERN